MADENQEALKVPKKSINDIKPLKFIKQLETLQLDLRSPRLVEAWRNLGISPKSLNWKYSDMYPESKTKAISK